VRMAAGRMTTFNLNIRHDDESETMSFQVLQEDTVTVPERLF
jgi:hypothetical protein